MRRRGLAGRTIVVTRPRAQAAELPRRLRAEELARAMAPSRGLRVLVPRAKEGRQELILSLRRAGARVSAVEAYRTVPDLESAKVLRAAAARGVDAVAFTSGSTARE